MSDIRRTTADLVFAGRWPLLAMFGLLTLLFGFFAAQVRIDAGFEKQLPANHPYMDTFREYQTQFGGANRLLIVLRARDGDIFTPHFMASLKQATDAVFFLPGIDRARVTSIFTPNTRFTEVVEDGFSGGNVVPADFEPVPEKIATVRENIEKAGIVGRLIAEDYSAAMITAELVERDPVTGEPLDYIAVAAELEKTIRDAFEDDRIAVHMIGFAKIVGDIAEGAADVLMFFAIAVGIAALVVWLFIHSKRLTLYVIACSLIAVVWQFGALTLLGYGIDPFSILIPFLIFAIAVSHGVQVVNAAAMEIHAGADSRNAAKAAFRRLIIPGGVALISDMLGFLTIMLIDVPVIQELAIAAGVGVACVIATNLILLPLLIGLTRLGDPYREKLTDSHHLKERVWNLLSVAAQRRGAMVSLAIALVLGSIGFIQSQKLVIGDQEAGVPELRPDSRYNLDAAAITERFSIGVDLIQVIVEAPENGCIDGDVIRQLDAFDWQMANVEGVQSTLSLPQVMKIVNAGWNEGHPAWRTLQRDRYVLVRATTPVETATGLLNADCSVMPVLIFTRDHKAETITRITEAVEAYAAEQADGPLDFRLATGNVGVMAATNEAVSQAQLPILLWVYAAVIVLCLVTFRSLAATFCIVAPLALVSLLAYGLMASLDIGLKVSTLPVAALGVGIGVDYGLYIFTRLNRHFRAGETLEVAYARTLRETGGAVLVTGLTLTIAVGSWVFSDLQLQADMGVLLAFMFLFNMLGALFLAPALARIMPAAVWRR